MVLPASGYLLLGDDGGASGRSINSAFGYGNDLSSYLGAYYDKGGNVFRFPVPGNSIGMNAFYLTAKIGSGTGYLPTGNWTVPTYNTISATVKGGDGGQSGAYGYNACSGVATGSGNGNAGGTSSFGGYLSAGGGAGGSGNKVSGKTGAINSSSWTNPVQGGSGPASGASVYITVGLGGSGGGGGSNCAYYGIYCLCPNNAANGSKGADGYVQVTWS